MFPLRCLHNYRNKVTKIKLFHGTIHHTDVIYSVHTEVLLRSKEVVTTPIRGQVLLTSSVPPTHTSGLVCFLGRLLSLCDWLLLYLYHSSLGIFLFYILLVLSTPFIVFVYVALKWRPFSLGEINQQIKKINYQYKKYIYK